MLDAKERHGGGAQRPARYLAIVYSVPAVRCRVELRHSTAENGDPIKFVCSVVLIGQPRGQAPSAQAHPSIHLLWLDSPIKASLFLLVKITAKSSQTCQLNIPGA